MGHYPSAGSFVTCISRTRIGMILPGLTH